MLFDLTHPDQVRPYLDRSAPLLERNPLGFYRWGFWILLLLNIVLLISFLYNG
jgi:hypothetical protein